MEGKRLLDTVDGHDDGMTSIVTTSAASTDISIRCEDVDKLSFALVAPLRAEHNRNWLIAIRCEENGQQNATHCSYEK